MIKNPLYYTSKTPGTSTPASLIVSLHPLEYRKMVRGITTKLAKKAKRDKPHIEKQQCANPPQIFGQMLKKQAPKLLNPTNMLVAKHKYAILRYFQVVSTCLPNLSHPKHCFSGVSSYFIMIAEKTT